MTYSVEYEPEVLVSLERLTPIVRDRVVNKINWLAENFEQITPSPLTADLAGFYKLRVGEYRVIYDFNSEERIITIDKIGHRREVYK
jgi:mRNA interferase RelE/StbE